MITSAVDFLELIQIFRSKFQKYAAINKTLNAVIREHYIIYLRDFNISSSINDEYKLKKKTNALIGLMIYQDKVLKNETLA